MNEWQYDKVNQIPDREQYEKDLAEKRRKHLEKVHRRDEAAKRPWRPCLHDACPQCYGTGVKKNGEACIHFISCPCPKCTPMMLCAV